MNFSEGKLWILCCKDAKCMTLRNSVFKVARKINIVGQTLSEGHVFCFLNNQKKSRKAQYLKTTVLIKYLYVKLILKPQKANDIYNIL